MGYGWKDIVPSDPYVIRFSRPIAPTELIYLTQLYQPLIGPLSVSLYTTLYHEKSIDHSVYGNHRFLMSMMCSPLDKLIKAREVLEAVGLLRTIKLTMESGENLYEYFLEPPMQPASFFGDDMMSMILLNRIGKSKYRYLREKLIGSVDYSETAGVREEITRSFDEIFHSISPSELVVKPGSETDHFISEMESAFPAKQAANTFADPNQSVRVRQPDIDFVFLEAAMPKLLGGNRRLTVEIRDTLKELAFFYQLDDMQLSYFLQEPYIYDDRNEILPEHLRMVVKDWYMKVHKGQPPQIVITEDAKQKTAVQNVHQLTREEEHKLALSQLSPISLLEQYQGGGKASPADIKIVDELAQQYRLAPGVINVLLEYVMMTNNKQLPKALIYKIATHWKRLNIKSVDEALDQAKQLHQAMKTRTAAPSKAVGYKEPSRKTQARVKNDLPEWIVRQLNESPQETAATVELDSEKKKEAMELLKALGEID